MSIDKIAILLEIIGFILASIFAGVLLEKGSLVNLNNRLYSFLSSFSARLKNIFPLPSRKEMKSSVFYLYFSIIGLYLPLSLVLIGSIKDIPAILIAGIALWSGFMTPALVMIFRSGFNRTVIREVAIDLFLLTIIIPLLLFIAIITILRFIAAWLSEEYVFKVLLLILGSVLLLSGLVIELVITP